MNIKELNDKQISELFIKYLVARGYSEFTPKGLPSTAYDYCKRIDYIIYYEKYKSFIDVIRNIKGLLIEYDIGGKRESQGKKSNCAVINALRRFYEFLIFSEKNCNIKSSHLYLLPNEINLINNEKGLLNVTCKDDITNYNFIYTLIIQDDFGDEIKKYYISDEDKNINATKILPKTEVAKMLINKSVGDVFIINDSKYTIKKIEEIEE